ncbi:MAG TPA: alpha/beta hydrolase [Acidimicrobiia bacterium]|jgi:acetyl esterase/lipase
MRLRAVVGFTVLAVVAAGCGYNQITPTGAAPLRYRDQKFAAVTKTADITYGSAVDQSMVTQALKLDLYQPTGDAIQQRPAIVWVHGGGFSGGDKTSGEIVDEANWFSKEGYVNVSINYRLYGPGCSATQGAAAGCLQAITDAQHDAQAAVRFLRKNATTYRIDPTRIAIGGSSAGAITALQVAANSEDPGTSGNPGYSSAVGGAVSLSGAKLLGAAMTAGDAPFLDFHGTNDPLVPYQWAVNSVNEAKAAGIIAYLTTYPGEGHVPYNHRDEILSQETDFLYWMLNLAKAQQ